MIKTLEDIRSAQVTLNCGNCLMTVIDAPNYHQSYESIAPLSATVGDFFTLDYDFHPGVYEKRSQKELRYLELFSYYNDANSAQELVALQSRLVQEIEDLTISESNFILHEDFGQPHSEMHVELPELSHLVTKKEFVSAEMIKQKYAQAHIGNIRDQTIRKIKSYLLNQHSSFLDSEDFKSIKHKLLLNPISDTTRKIKNDGNEAQYFDLSVLPVKKRDELKRDLFDHLRQHKCLDEKQNFKQFQTLFSEHKKNHYRINWTGGLADLTIFVKLLGSKLKIDRKYVIAAERFLLEGKEISASQLNNNSGKSPNRKQAKLLESVESSIKEYLDT